MTIQEANIVTPAAFEFETVAVSQTGQALGSAGAKGDRLERLIITVITSATGTVSLLDAATSIAITAANTPIGVYVVDIGAYSQEGAWSITTGAGASVIAVGTFT